MNLANKIVKVKIMDRVYVDGLRELNRFVLHMIKDGENVKARGWFGSSDIHMLSKDLGVIIYLNRVVNVISQHTIDRLDCLIIDLTQSPTRSSKMEILESIISHLYGIDENIKYIY